MRVWKFEDGIEVHEIPFDYSLHAFAVWDGDDYLGGIYPGDVKDMEKCIAELDSGSNPVRDGWDDGLGNICDERGWNLDYFIDGKRAYETWKEAVWDFEAYKEQVTGWEPDYHVRSGVYRGVRVWQLSDRDGTKIDKESLNIPPMNIGKSHGMSRLKWIFRRALPKQLTKNFTITSLPIKVLPLPGSGTF